MTPLSSCCLSPELGILSKDNDTGMTNQLRKRAFRRCLQILGAVTAFSGTSACRKPAPDEVVYRGKSVLAPINAQGATGGRATLGGAGGSGGGTGGAPVGPSAGGARGLLNPGSGGFSPVTSGGSTQANGGVGGAVPTTEPLVPRPVSCGTTPTGTPFSKEALLGSIAECAVKAYVDFEVSARGLSLGLAGTPTGSTPEEAWRSTMRAWQHAELFRFGPAARSTEPGGRDLRDHIYAWPLMSRCKIEEQLVSQVYAAPGFAATTINARGLGSLEYLLFYPGNDNSCSAFSPINTGAWAALAPAALAGRKRAYAESAAKDTAARADSLLSLWDPASGNFCRELTLAGAGSQTFGSTQLALNAVSDALFYMDKEFKDWKLGRPVGLVECAAVSCPEAVESPYSGTSLEHLRANVKGFRKLFQGCGEGHLGLGFDDWLVAVGANDLNSRMLAALDNLELKLGAIQLPLEDLVRKDTARGQELHQAARALTDLLKTEFITLLNLDLPKSVEGDND